MIKKSLLVLSVFMILSSSAAFADGRRDDRYDRRHDYRDHRHAAHSKYVVRHSPYFSRVKIIERPVYIAPAYLTALPPGTVLVYQNGIPYYYSYANQTYYTHTGYGYTACNPFGF